eukprot:scaffold746_cov123-Cylindrotheca_fusiformis.AAC.31
MTEAKETATTNEQIPPTEMIYYTYDGNFQMDCTAKVLSVQLVDEKTVEVCLDKTVMHAQGGGQPTDKGSISAVSASAEGGSIVDVTKVLIDRSTGIATHTGKVESPDALEPGDDVYVKVDEETRRLLSECVRSNWKINEWRPLLFIQPIAPHGFALSKQILAYCRSCCG